MTGSGKDSEAHGRPAGFAGPMRQIMLILTGVVCLVAGVAGGLALQNSWKPSSEISKTSPGSEDTHESEKHSSDGEAPEQPDESHAADTEAAPTDLLSADQQLETDDHDEMPRPDAFNATSGDPLTSSDEDHAKLHEASPLASNVPAATATASPAAVLPTTPAPPPVISRHGSAIDERRSEAEKRFRAGNLRQARDDFQMLVAGPGGTVDLELLLKLALCEETLGNLREAQADFRKVLESTSNLAIRNSALQGQARLWARSGRSDLATFSLFRVLLEGMPPNDVSPLPHHLGALVAARVQPIAKALDATDSLLNDSLLLKPESVSHPVEIWDSVASHFVTEPPRYPVLRHDVVIDRQVGSSLNGITVSLQFERASVLDILTKTLKATGFQVQIDPQAKTQLQSHTLQPQCREIPLGLVLDALLDPLDLIWLQNENQIQVLPAVQAKVDDLSAFRHGVAIRILQHASETVPDHPLKVASQIELARLRFQEGATEESIRLLERTIATAHRSRFLPTAWFNLGKLLMQQGRPGDATIAFYHAADMQNGENLETVGYLFVGRILLESDDPRAAITPLTRALALANGSRYEAIASMQLSSAYLMLNHYERANGILMEHLKVLEQPVYRDQAAFLSMLIHFSRSTEQEERFRIGTNLVGTLTNLNAATLFGGHWQLLVGQAYRDTGMTHNAVQIFMRCLESSYSFPLQNRMRGMLLRDAPELISRLAADNNRGGISHHSPDTLQVDSLLLEAESSYNQSRYDEAIRACREIWRRKNVSDAHRRAALKLMGQAYQAKGNYEESVECFTGVLPKDIPPSPPPGASLPRGVLR